MTALDPEQLPGRVLEPRLGWYRAEAVDALLAQLRASYEQVWAASRAFAADAERLEGELQLRRELGGRIGDARLAAEEAAAERNRRAEREAQGQVEQVRSAAARMIAEARAEQASLQRETERLRELWGDLRIDYRAFLIAALQLAEADENDQFEDAARVLRAEAARRAGTAIAQRADAWPEAEGERPPQPAEEDEAAVGGRGPREAAPSEAHDAAPSGRRAGAVLPAPKSAVPFREVPGGGHRRLPPPRPDRAVRGRRPTPARTTSADDEYGSDLARILGKGWLVLRTSLVFIAIVFLCALVLTALANRR